MFIHFNKQYFNDVIIQTTVYGWVTILWWVIPKDQVHLVATLNSILRAILKVIWRPSWFFFEGEIYFLIPGMKRAWSSKFKYRRSEWLPWNAWFISTQHVLRPNAFHGMPFRIIFVRQKLQGSGDCTYGSDLEFALEIEFKVHSVKDIWTEYKLTIK